METPSFLAPFVEGNSPKRLFQGLAVGAIGTMVIGFAWGGWQLGSTVDEKVANASQTATVSALAPICADKFVRAAKADRQLIVELNAANSWQRDAVLTKAGWATFPGEPEANSHVAEACAAMLTATLKLK